MALYDFEKKLVGQGITTMLHSLSLGVGLSVRGVHLFTEMVNTITDYRKQSTLIRNLIHMRYEITYFDVLDIFEDYVTRGVVDYISLMNHYPGQGQYRAPGSFEKYVMKNQGVDQYEVKDIVNSIMAKQSSIDWDKLRRITELAKEKGIAIASHDDDSPEKVDESIQLNVKVVEFPITAETAAYATNCKLHVCVGAPNVVRGGSHENNLNAFEAIKKGHADILCSDYHPSTLLASVFMLHNNGFTLPEAVNLASLNPARALGLDGQFGSLEVGKKADIILVSKHQGHPNVRNTWVDGNPVYTCGYFEVRD
jgi:alpha-D-ribose 1-methylphosphonate 5-triphosphate diphosphatase